MTSLWWENGCSLEDGGKHGTSLQGELVLPKEWNEVSWRSDIYPAGRVGVHHGMEGSPRVREGDMPQWVQRFPEGV
jgi:hypothetical protein